MTITAAGQAQMAEREQRRREHRRQANAARLADDIANLRQWDLVHTDYTRGAALRCGHVLDMLADDDQHGDRVRLLEVTLGGAGADLGGVDATAITPCDVCGMLPGGTWDTRTFTVAVDHVVSVSPCRSDAQRLVLSHKLAGAAASRRRKLNDDNYRQLLAWAHQLAAPQEAAA